MDGSTVWVLAVPPVAGGVIGYFTNDLAIKMLFRPYRAIKIGQRSLPFTPGLIPRNQDRLANRISDTIMGSLLTPEELQALARRLLDPERVQGALKWLLQMALDQIKAETDQKATQVFAHILRDFVSQSLPRLTSTLARREDFLQTQLNQIFDQVLLEIQLSEAQAQNLANWVIDVVFPPDALRVALIDFLTDRNIEVLDEGFREKTSGTYWVVANLLGARNALTRFRTFCIEEREACNVRLAELIVALGIKVRLAEWFSSASLQSLPVSTVRQLRATFRDSVRSYFQDKGADFLQNLGSSVDWDEVTSLILSRLRMSEAVATSLDVISEELALILERYLERDLEVIVAKAIPILNLDQVIVDRVKRTPPQDLEAAIQGIVKTELQAIVTLGGVLGVVIGLLQSVILVLR
ncbi:DUF445 family protein [Synechococcales cyanobacterium C]|uniref:DUF445 family protein n=1 Tax=Petrachloros mirabilis ULC683 TaxID=2781853 RepID=A0A8K2ABT7_9CYAN|nr:DUF445 family protein [Petrachloros mirabilis]NCJ05159.1 DUF445 family protein [Petrachloros mirabilis ULC683]